MSWRRRSRTSYRQYDYYSPYPPKPTVGELQARADRETGRLAAKGAKLSPVRSRGRKIADTFWGRAWCTNLDNYADYANRLPRGKSYLAHGQVLDLQVSGGKVEALVAGSRPTPYRVSVTIQPLAPQRWNEIVRACAGKIDSMLELLQGKLSSSVMETVTAPRTGLFPSAAEIKFNCSCPDWASMCKHVAASLYGIGARLDDAPELLFLLRGVEPAELVTGEGAARAITSQAEHKALQAESDELASMFGIELEAAPAASAKPVSKRPRAPKPSVLMAAEAPPPAASVSKPAPLAASASKPALKPTTRQRAKPKAPVRAPTPATPRSGAIASKKRGSITKRELLSRKVPEGVIDFWLDEGLLLMGEIAGTFLMTREVQSRIERFGKAPR